LSPNEDEVTLERKRLWIGIGAGVVFLALLVTGVIALWRFLNPDPTASQREPVTALGYCNAGNVTPCIVSFGSASDNSMLVNLLLPEADFPAVYLTIARGSDSFYFACESLEAVTAGALCTGWPMPPGETLQFKLFVLADDTLLAEGQFAIIGLLLPSPVAEATSTLITETPMAAPTEIVFETATPGVIDLPGLFPTATPGVIDLPGLFPTATPTGSYPNPSYPGPSYNNP
jgi:hypothetical protein